MSECKSFMIAMPYKQEIFLVINDEEGLDNLLNRMNDILDNWTTDELEFICHFEMSNLIDYEVTDESKIKIDLICKTAVKLLKKFTSMQHIKLERVDYNYFNDTIENIWDLTTFKLNKVTGDSIRLTKDMINLMFIRIDCDIEDMVISPNADRLYELSISNNNPNYNWDIPFDKYQSLDELNITGNFNYIPKSIYKLRNLDHLMIKSQNTFVLPRVLNNIPSYFQIDYPILLRELHVECEMKKQQAEETLFTILISRLHTIQADHFMRCRFNSIKLCHNEMHLQNI